MALTMFLAFGFSGSVNLYAADPIIVSSDSELITVEEAPAVAPEATDVVPVVVVEVVNGDDTEAVAVDEVKPEGPHSTGPIDPVDETDTISPACAVPSTLGENGKQTLIANGEKSVQDMLKEAGFKVDTKTDQTNYQIWNTSAHNITVKAEYLGGYTSLSRVFGYYFKGDLTTFVPLFRIGESKIYPEAPEFAVGKEITFTIPKGKAFAFAINTQFPSDEPNYFDTTEMSQNVNHYKQAVTFNANETDTTSDTSKNGNYIIAFEDAKFNYSDSDYNDTVVRIEVVNCDNGSVVVDDSDDTALDSDIDTDTDSDNGNGGRHRRHHSSNNGNGGEVLGASTGPSCSYLNSYLNIKWNNNPVEVLKLQSFLKNNENMSDVTLNGIYDNQTFEAVSKFQTRYSDEIIKPWGDTPKGFVYILTKKKINELYCGSEFKFPLTLSEINEIHDFKAAGVLAMR